MNRRRSLIIRPPDSGKHADSKQHYSSMLANQSMEGAGACNATGRALDGACVGQKAMVRTPEPPGSLHDASTVPAKSVAPPVTQGSHSRASYTVGFRCHSFFE